MFEYGFEDLKGINVVLLVVWYFIDWLCGAGDHNLYHKQAKSDYRNIQFYRQEPM